MVTIPNKVVAKAKNKEALQGIFEMRRFMEGQATEIAAQKIQASDIDILETLNEQMAAIKLDGSDYLISTVNFTST